MGDRASRHRVQIVGCHSECAIQKGIFGEKAMLIKRFRSKATQMTYTLRRYQSYQADLENEDLSHDGHYRLLSTGEEGFSVLRMSLKPINPAHKSKCAGLMRS